MGIFLHHLYNFMLKDFKFFVNEVWRKVQVFCVQNGIPVAFAQEKMQDGGVFWKQAGFRRKNRVFCQTGAAQNKDTGADGDADQ